jgi:type I restriction enzyme, S subunit
MITKETIKGKFPIKELGEVVEFLDSRRRPITAADRVQGPYPYYGANGQQDLVADFIFDEPLILLAEDGGLFDQPDRGIAYTIEGKTWVNNHAHVIRTGESIQKQYLVRVLENYDVTPWITGSTRAKLTKAGASKILIPLPPLSEQKRIASILDASDALRAKRREALEQLDTLLQSTFLDMFGDPVTNPKGWEEVEFETIIESKKLGMSRGSKEFGWGMPIPYVRMDAITNDGRFLRDKVQGTNATQKDVDTYALKSGDFLFNTRNSKELVGKVAIFRETEGWTFNNNIMRIRFIDGVEPDVVCTQFRFARVQQSLNNRKSGTTSVFAVYWKSLKTLPILVPPVALQESFARIVEKIEAQKARMREQLTELDTLFATLQQRAFNGEL